MLARQPRVVVLFRLCWAWRAWWRIFWRWRVRDVIAWNRCIWVRTMKRRWYWLRGVRTRRAMRRRYYIGVCMTCANVVCTSCLTSKAPGTALLTQGTRKFQQTVRLHQMLAQRQERVQVCDFRARDDSDAYVWRNRCEGKSGSRDKVRCCD